jgi:hypothetical protein
VRLRRLGGNHDVGSVLGASQSNGFPDATTGACDEDRATGELPERNNANVMGKAPYYRSRRIIRLRNKRNRKQIA